MDIGLNKKLSEVSFEFPNNCDYGWFIDYLREELVKRTEIEFDCTIDEYEGLYKTVSLNAAWNLRLMNIALRMANRLENVWANDKRNSNSDEGITTYISKRRLLSELWDKWYRLSNPIIDDEMSRYQWKITFEGSNLITN